MLEKKSATRRYPDAQYQNLLRLILEGGERQEANNQKVPCLSYFKPPDLIYDLTNGAPLITERAINFWRKAVGEIFAMINGARTATEFRAFGCDWWDQWATKEICDHLNLPEGDLGEGSYGVAFHNFPTPGLPHGFNQFEALVRGLKSQPWSRTNIVSPWIPYYASEWGKRQVFVAPCHGWITCYVANGRLDLCMDQRSCDVPIGLPANLIQYAALLLALAQVTGLKPGRYIHTIKNAHIYDNQRPAVEEMIRRKPHCLPTLTIKNSELNNLFHFRPDDFELHDYEPHPAIKNIPVAL
ncbi:MAG: thymidylate synthase [Candidatus Vogelbacteria bacterium CG10_big_fil_rev_8_21_14_0_10_49_38]|uniref:Thymidylate synthase n=1 Tax=Candidatus Vogelbacteria bacterium CG10_big_fil_rev_8_21_14_0_10_49_38 TaxID=1975043 RepID=A0A2H0RIB1_9BACT|nr:MAG: thymidylate synthase [bacterium CG10_49_38]PIR46279.1 MAG: thymidylate synthase [Candidatus Vogelbacteria bacterium CG10_big_fil_rev_8_21_14_0_10_49_38]